MSFRPAAPRPTRPGRPVRTDGGLPGLAAGSGDSPYGSRGRGSDRAGAGAVTDGGAALLRALRRRWREQARVALGCQALRGEAEIARVGFDARVWVPNIWSPHATCAYSWTSPSSRSWRTTRASGDGRGGWSDASGGACRKAGVGDGCCSAGRTRQAHAPAAGVRRSGVGPAAHGAPCPPTAPQRHSPAAPGPA